jgi:uncharacterized membrane protein
MFAAGMVANGLLAIALIPSALGKLLGDQRQIDGMRAVKFLTDKMWLLGAAELAGAVGLIVGLFWWPLGVAAATCLIAYFIGALGYLFRARITQPKALTPAVVLLLVAIASVVLRIATSPMPAALTTRPW